MMVFDRDDITFTVVVNHEDQYSIWPVFKDIPDGWKEVGVRGTKKECLDHIDKVWTDMRPLSLRKFMDDARSPSNAE
jgi:MbtH protein